MAGEEPARRRAGKRTPKRMASTGPETMSQAGERRLVDIDPWAVLLEQLMEVPEEEPVEKARKGK